MHPAHAAPRALAALALASLLAASCAPQPNGGPAPRLAADPAARPGEAKAATTPERPPILGPEASAVTFDRMAKFPEPGWNVPRRVAFSPDGALVTYLQSESQDLE